MKHLNTQQQGFSMIEVLITVLIIAIGLLGVASMQSVGLRQAVASQSSTQAQLMAQDLAEMIIAYDPNGTGDYAFNGVPNAMGTNCATTACTRAQLATYNVFQWDASMDAELPSLDLDIIFNAAGPSYEIRMTWDAERQGSGYVASTCTAANGLNPGCFAMTIEL